MHTLVLGGVRSGKSRYAESLLADASSVCYVATAPPRPGDEEWAARIAAHRQHRPSHWRTVECGENPESLPTVLATVADTEAILIDDLGSWVTALYDRSGWEPQSARRAFPSLITALRWTQIPVVLVSPEVGLSVVPENRAARMFADALGELNQMVGEVATGVALVVAGQPMWIKGGAPSSLSS